MTGEKIMPTDNSLPGLSSGSDGGENGCSSGPNSDPNTPSASSPEESANISTGSSDSLADEDFELGVDALDNGLPALTATVPVSSTVPSLENNLMMSNAASVAIQLSQLTMLSSPFSPLSSEDGVALDNGHPRQGQAQQQRPSRNQTDSTTSSSSVDSPPPSQPPPQGPLDPVGGFDMFPMSPLTFAVDHVQQTPMQQRANRTNADGHSQSFHPGFLPLSQTDGHSQQSGHSENSPWATTNNSNFNYYNMSSMEFDAMVAELNVGQPPAPFDNSHYQELLGASQQQNSYTNGGHNGYMVNGGLVSGDGGFGAGAPMSMSQGGQNSGLYSGVGGQCHGQLHAASSHTFGFLNGAPGNSSTAFVNGSNSQPFGYPNGTTSSSSSASFHAQHGPNNHPHNGYGPFSNGGGGANHSPSLPPGQGGPGVGYSNGAASGQVGAEEYPMVMMGNGGGGDHDPHNQAASGNKADRDRKPNYTECVDVFTSEHVAEIVGRQGCKIKDLRQRTNTYIRTPTRQEPPIFTVTGVKEKVIAAASEIRRMRDHFTGIRDSRRSRQNNPDEECDTVHVPVHLVGLVVGPKGATVKKIQKDSGAYIVTPSRQADPIFIIRGQRHEIDSAIKMIQDYIKERTRDNQDHPNRERRTRSPRAIHGSHPPSPDPVPNYHQHHNSPHPQTNFGHASSNGAYSNGHQHHPSSNGSANNWFGSQNGVGGSDSSYTTNGHNGYSSSRRSAFSTNGYGSENGSNNNRRNTCNSNSVSSNNSNNSNSSSNGYPSGVLPNVLGGGVSNSFPAAPFINSLNSGLPNNTATNMHANTTANLGSNAGFMGASSSRMNNSNGTVNAGCNGWLSGAGSTSNSMAGWGMTNGMSNSFGDTFSATHNSSFQSSANNSLANGFSNGMTNGLTSNGLIGGGLSGLLTSVYDNAALRGAKNFSATPGAGRRGSDTLSRFQSFVPPSTNNASSIPASSSTNHHSNNNTNNINNEASRNNMSKSSCFSFPGNLLEFLDKPENNLMAEVRESHTPLPSSLDVHNSTDHPSFFRGSKFNLPMTTSFSAESGSTSIYTESPTNLVGCSPSAEANNAWSPSLSTSRRFPHLTVNKEGDGMKRQGDRQQQGMGEEVGPGVGVNEVGAKDVAKDEQKDGKREDEQQDSQEKERAE